MPIFTSKNKEGSISVNFSFVDGISAYKLGEPMNLTLDNENKRVKIKKRLSKIEPHYIDYSQLQNVSLVAETEVIEKNKSSIGRAVVGGVLIGPLGAIVGGISGIGSKKSSKSKKYLIINYVPKARPNETSIVSFEVVGATIGLDKFINELKSKFTIVELKEEPEDAYL